MVGAWGFRSGVVQGKANLKLIGIICILGAASWPDLQRRIGRSEPTIGTVTVHKVEDIIGDGATVL